MIVDKSAFSKFLKIRPTRRRCSEGAYDVAKRLRWVPAQVSASSVDSDLKLRVAISPRVALIINFKKKIKCHYLKTNMRCIFIDSINSALLFH